MTQLSDKRILIVEDDDAIRALLFTVLRRRGFHIDTASDGASAIERCRECHYAVVLLDLMMPVVSGYEVLDCFKELDARQRPLVLVMTAGTEPRHLDPSLVAGCMRKPFDVELLIDMVTGCLNTVHAQEQLPSCPPAESEEAAPNEPI